MESSGSQKSKYLQAMDSVEDDLEFSPKSGSLHFELFNAAYTGKLNNFKWLALDHAKGDKTGVGNAIRNLVDESGRGSLHVAASGGSLKVCNYLLETLKLDVDSKDGNGHTPLYHAALKGHLGTVSYLLEMGANADACNDTDYTPLHCAAMIGNTKIITLLLSRVVHVDVATRSGTPLLLAAGHGHRDVVKVLLDHGANPNFVSQGMLRPLILAIFIKSRECVELLLQAGADPNAVSCGNTPLVAAAKDGCVDIIARLLKAGADPNFKMNAGLTALEVAALYDNHQIVEVLFPVTSHIPTYPDWSISGLLRDAESDANTKQREVYKMEKFHQAKSKGREAFQGEQYLMATYWFEEALAIFPDDPAVLSNMSACFARLGDGINALDYATECMCESPEWPKAYYRLGVALNILKRYNDAADAFNKGLTLDPRNKELKDAYMKAIENKLNSINVEEDNAE